METFHKLQMGLSSPIMCPQFPIFFFLKVMGVIILGFPGGSVVKNLPAKQETHIQCLGWEDTLEKEIATHSSIPAWRISWREEPGRLQSVGLRRIRNY